MTFVKNATVKTVTLATLMVLMAMTTIIVVSAGSTIASAQAPLRFVRYSAEDGLSQISVLTAMQDSRGFMWMGTFDGLNRFDGKHFTVFRNRSGDSTSLGKNWVSAVYEDRSGTIWVGTRGGGLNQFHRTSESFTAHRHDPSDPTSMSSNNAQAMYEDRSGALWIGTRGGGLNVLDPAERIKASALTGALTSSAASSAASSATNSATKSASAKLRFRAFKHDPANPRSLSGNNIWCIYEDRLGALWVGTQSAGLNRFDRASGACTRFQNNPNDPRSLAGNTVRMVVEDKHGTLWVATDNGLCSFDRSSQTFQRFQAPLALTRYNGKENAVNVTNTGLAGNDVRALAVDGDNLWVGTDGGLSRINTGVQAAQFSSQPSAFVCESFTNDSLDARSLGGNQIETLCLDRSGTLWVGSFGGGVSTYSPSANKFSSLWRGFDALSLSMAKSGRLWIGSAGYGVWCYSPHSPHSPRAASGLGSTDALANPAITRNQLTRNDPIGWTNFRHDPTKPNASIGEGNVHSVLEDRNGAVWVATTRGGLAKLTLRSSAPLPVVERIDVFRHDPTNPQSLSDDAVYTLYEDSKGTLWVGTRGGGLNRYNPQSRTFTRFGANPNDNTSLSHDYVFAILEDSKGTLWVGTNDGGLNRMKPDGTGFVRYQHNPNDPRSLSSNHILALHESRAERRNGKSILWVCTDAGLNRFDPETGMATAFRESEFGSDNLPNDIVYGVLEDEHGRLWVSTNKGLARSAPQSQLHGQMQMQAQRFHTFNAGDGLLANEFNTHGAVQGADGRMYFASVRGVTVFHPDSIRTNASAPLVSIVGLRKFNRPTQRPPLLDSAIQEKRVLHLDYTDSFVTFEFAALDYTNPAKNRYACRLEGFDNQWIDLGTQPFVTYTNLDGGSYVLHVKAANADDIWNEEGATLAVIVHPPWWLRWWFKLLSALVLVSVVIGLYKLRVRTMQAQRIRLESEVQERTSELQESNIEIQRQLSILDEQARQIEVSNTELQEKNLRLQQLNADKNELLGIVAHDLRNPLASIVMTASAIERNIGAMNEAHATNPVNASDGTRDTQATQAAPTLTFERVKAGMERIRVVGGRMSEIISNVLDLNAIETGTIQLKLETVDLVHFVSEVVHELEGRATEKNITLTLALETAPILVCADQTALWEVIENLVSNAVKYSPLGSNVRIAVAHTLVARTAVAHAAESQQLVRMSVRDEGPGLTDDDQRKLFGRFVRLSAKPTGGESSTGLGLSIAKTLIERMGGRIWCESQPESGVQGATFAIELPVL
jgi:signal transduction histidine kinase/ligand-binding sensor domain-containing protein